MSTLTLRIQILLLSLYLRGNSRVYLKLSNSMNFNYLNKVIEILLKTNNMNLK